MRLPFCAGGAAALWAILAVSSVHADMAGHGGSVRALAISPDGDSLLSGSFDSAAIRWSLKAETAEEVLRYHADAVNAVAFLNDGRMITAGADARIAVWTAGRRQPDRVFEGHVGPIVALAVSPDGALLASASWDRTVRIWSLSDGVSRVLEGPFAERQRRRLHAGRQVARQRRLRPYVAYLAFAG
ncbi:WD40 repeat protein [Bradyrhizobium ottawaense]